MRHGENASDDACVAVDDAITAPLAIPDGVVRSCQPVRSSARSDRALNCI